MPGSCCAGRKSCADFTVTNLRATSFRLERRLRPAPVFLRKGAYVRKTSRKGRRNHGGQQWYRLGRGETVCARRCVRVRHRPACQEELDKATAEIGKNVTKPLECVFYDLGMHCSFDRADALFVIAMQGQPLLHDPKMQFTKTATPRCGAAVTLLRWCAQMSLRANLRSMGSR